MFFSGSEYSSIRIQKLKVRFVDTELCVILGVDEASPLVLLDQPPVKRGRDKSMGVDFLACPSAQRSGLGWGRLSNISCCVGLVFLKEPPVIRTVVWVMKDAGMQGCSETFEHDSASEHFGWQWRGGNNASSSSAGAASDAGVLPDGRAHTVSHALG